MAGTVIMQNRRTGECLPPLGFPGKREAHEAARQMVTALVSDKHLTGIKADGFIGVGILSVLDSEVRVTALRHCTTTYSHPESNVICYVLW